MVYPDFIRRCILFVEGIQDYQVTQTEDGQVQVALSKRSPEIEEAILNQFQVLADQKGFIMPTLTFIDYQWDTSRKLKRVQRLQK